MAPAVGRSLQSSGTTRLGGRGAGCGRDRQGPESDGTVSASLRRAWLACALGSLSGPRAHASQTLPLSCESHHGQRIVEGLWPRPSKRHWQELVAQPQRCLVRPHHHCTLFWASTSHSPRGLRPSHNLSLPQAAAGLGIFPPRSAAHRAPTTLTPPPLTTAPSPGNAGASGSWKRRKQILP